MTIDVDVYRDPANAGRIVVSRSSPRCCGEDEEPPPDGATTHDEIKAYVRQAYARIAEEVSGGCSCGCDASEPMTAAYADARGYLAEADLGLGCGHPTAHAALRPGQTVLDLGSGAGIDAFLAREVVGDTGSVIGVDMTSEMVGRAQANARKLGYKNVQFLLGEIEDLPVADDSIDVVLSNCVLNLVPDKQRAFAEMYRVLRPGGFFVVSDIVVEGELGDEIRQSLSLHAACVAGAMEYGSYLSGLEAAGFVGVRVLSRTSSEVPADALQEHGAEPSRGSAEAAVGRRQAVLVSVTVWGEKPVESE